MKEINSFDDIGHERYCSLKDSVESLMKIMNLEGLEKDEQTRVLTALIQLITDNSDKPMDLRVSDTREIVNTGVLRSYFAAKDKETAVQILSNTSILNEVERLIYTINFYMPNDKDFINVYNKFKKDVEKIAEDYGLSGKNAAKFVHARITEIHKFGIIYNDYKENQAKQPVSESQVSESQVFVALQEASDNPTKENIENARRLIMALQNESLKAMLTEKLEMLGINALSNQQGGYWDIPEDPSASGFSPEEEEVYIPPHLEFASLEPVQSGNELSEPHLQLNASEDTTEMTPVMEEVVVEPIPLRVIQETKPADDDVAKEVKESLQLLVSKAKNDATRVQELEGALASTQGELSRVNALADEQAETIARQSNKIIDFEEAMKASEGRIRDLERECERKDELIANQDETIKEQSEEMLGIKAELQERRAENEELLNENRNIRLQLGSYKATIMELGEMVKGAHDMGECKEESHRKVA